MRIIQSRQSGSFFMRSWMNVIISAAARSPESSAPTDRPSASKLGAAASASTTGRAWSSIRVIACSSEIEVLESRRNLALERVVGWRRHRTSVTGRPRAEPKPARWGGVSLGRQIVTPETPDDARVICTDNHIDPFANVVALWCGKAQPGACLDSQRYEASSRSSPTSSPDEDPIARQSVRMRLSPGLSRICRSNLADGEALEMSWRRWA